MGLRDTEKLALDLHGHKRVAKNMKSDQEV